MNAQEILNDFVRVVKNDKVRSQYLIDISKDYDADEFFIVYPHGVEINFIPFLPITSKKLKNGGYLTVTGDYEHDKNGFIHHVTRIRKSITTPSGYIYDGDVIEKNGQIVYDDILMLTKKPRLSFGDKKLIKEIRETEELARKELIKISDAYNYYNELGYDYGKDYEMRAHRTRIPSRKPCGIRVNVRKMF